MVVTKDRGFVSRRVLYGLPRLLLLTVGNCTNAELEAFVLPNLDALVAALTMHGFVELSRAGLIIRQ